MHWVVLLGIAVVSDLLDYALVGSVPFAGDVLDLLTVGVLFPYVGIESGLGLIELVPGADFLPTYTALAVWRIWQEYQQTGNLAGLDISRTSIRS